MLGVQPTVAGALSRLFISHSSADNIAAIAFKQWLGEHDWPDEDVFLDLDGIGAGESWKEALRKANARCEAVILLASPHALSSVECVAEVRKAEDFGKEIIVVLLHDVQIDDRRLDSFKDRQIVNLSAPPQNHVETVTYLDEEHEVHFNSDALARIKEYLIRRGITPDRFAWPPADKPNAEPYPGLAAFTEDDAGIFFGRESDILRGLDKIRVLHRDGRPRLLAIQAASGAGKSSYLRAGLWPRLIRDSDFAPLAILRPAQGILTGPEGLGRKLAALLSRPGLPVSPGDIHAQLTATDPKIARDAFARLMVAATTQALEQRRIGDCNARPPALILAIDQAEELISPEDITESRRFLQLVASLLHEPPEGVELFAIMTIRSDGVSRLFQAIADLDVEIPETLLLLALPHTAYRDVILKPLELLSRRGQRLAMGAPLADRLVSDATGADALPLLAFTLSHLYQEFGASGTLTLDQYEAMGGIVGSIDMALKHALARPNDAPAIPTARDEQLAVLRATFIPWLSRIDPDTGAATRRVARLHELPERTRAMVERLVEARLLVTDRRSGADVIEVTHESLLRQWGVLAAWLQADADDLRLVEEVERAATEWVRNGRLDGWLDHRAERLVAAERAANRDDFRRRLGDEGVAYLNTCRARAQARTVFLQRSALLVATVIIFAMTLLRATDPTAVSDQRAHTYNLYQKLQPRVYSDAVAGVVNIDEESLQAFGAWPWPRMRLVALVNRLRDLGAAVIAFDMIFAEPDHFLPTSYLDKVLNEGHDPDAQIIKTWLARLPDFDKELATAVRQSPVVLGFITGPFESNKPPLKADVNYDGTSVTSLVRRFQGTLSNLPGLDDAATGIGALTYRAETSGVVQRLPMMLSDGQGAYPSLVSEALRVALKQHSILIRGTGVSGTPLDFNVANLRVPLTVDGEMWLYYDRDSHDRYISVKDVLDEEKEAIVRPHINGKIVFVGASAVGLDRNTITPLGAPIKSGGVFAQAVEQIIGRAYLTRPDWANGVEIVATFVLGASLALLILAFGARFAAVTGFVVVGVMAGFAWFAFSHIGLLLDPVYPLVAAGCVYFSLVGVLYFATDGEKRLIRQMFAWQHRVKRK
jgi:CHASE2 domain-containing sensor protein